MSLNRTQSSVAADDILIRKKVVIEIFAVYDFSQDMVVVSVRSLCSYEL